MLMGLHMQEKRYSGDRFISPEEIAFRAKEPGMDGVCITAHDTMGLCEYAADYAGRERCPIIAGVENIR